MFGFIELYLRERVRTPNAVPYARRKRNGHFTLEIAAPEGVYVLQRQRGGAREFRTFEVLLKLLASEGVVEFAVLLDDAKVAPVGPVAPWNRPKLQGDISRASWRHDFDIPF